jgi:hypothetical protein
LLARPGTALAQHCTPVLVGIDTTFANTSRSPFLGKALGQTFLAQDTVLSRITIWRWRNDLSVVGVHLFITAVDTTQTPPRPDTQQILLDGPTLTVYDSAPPGQFIELAFELSPPLVLPRPGLYAWFVQADACNGGSVWNIAANDTNPDPNGNYWITNRAVQGCYLPAVSGGEDLTDLLYQIEYCRAETTPTLRRSWGELKVIYH